MGTFRIPLRANRRESASPSADRKPNGTSASRGSMPKPAKKPKHRQNESSLPPAISNDAPAADDPVLSAIPLGRGRMPQRTSWRAPPVSPIPKRAGFQPPPTAPTSDQPDPSPVPARIPQTEEQALSNFNDILGLVNQLPDP
ncbi:hypothetical protein M3Y99_00607400 [Aphelenchoides fujianensis]|nr:hypothetical protein M3Y99_00607400 [Aphelenchoides fujianensis]